MPVPPAGFVLPVDSRAVRRWTARCHDRAGNGHPRWGRKLFVANMDDVASEQDSGCGMDDKHGPSPTPTCSDGTPKCRAGHRQGSARWAAELLRQLRRYLHVVPVAHAAAIMDSNGAPCPGARSGAARLHPSCSTDFPARAEPIRSRVRRCDRRRRPDPRAGAALGLSDVDGAAASVTSSQESRADTDTLCSQQQRGRAGVPSCHPRVTGRASGISSAADRGAHRMWEAVLIGTRAVPLGGRPTDFSNSVETVLVEDVGPVHSRAAVDRGAELVERHPGQTGRAGRNGPPGEARSGTCSTVHPGVLQLSTPGPPSRTTPRSTSGFGGVPGASLRGVAGARHTCTTAAPRRWRRGPSRFCSGGDAHGRRLSCRRETSTTWSPSRILWMRHRLQSHGGGAARRGGERTRQRRRRTLRGLSCVGKERPALAWLRFAPLPVGTCGG